MKAMIFAAGLGTRLKPLTNNIPKALVNLNGKPLIQHVIERLLEFEITEIVVNVHHFAGEVVKFLANLDIDIDIYFSDETSKLLETGGGLYNARDFFKNEEFFLVHNVDIIADFNLFRLIDKHLKKNAIATLAVQNRQSSRKLYFDNDEFLCKWKNEKTGEEKIARQCENSTPFAFCGIQVVSPKIFEYMTEGKYSIIDTYLSVAKTEKISMSDFSGNEWYDLGTIDVLRNLTR